jgi:hypothetical protein
MFNIFRKKIDHNYTLSEKIKIICDHSYAEEENSLNVNYIKDKGFRISVIPKRKTTKLALFDRYNYASSSSFEKAISELFEKLPQSKTLVDNLISELQNEINYLKSKIDSGE